MKKTMSIQYGLAEKSAGGGYGCDWVKVCIDGLTYELSVSSENGFLIVRPKRKDTVVILGKDDTLFPSCLKDI